FNVIGGNQENLRNLISGNQGSGVKIEGATATTNQVIGNYIGTDITGTTDVANGDWGVFVKASGTVIGGLQEGQRNVISGNKRAGVYIQGAVNVLVLGNYIGTNKTGEAKVPNNGTAGVYVNNDCINVHIGGTDAGAKNVISGNVGAGVFILNSQFTYVQGNYIGTNAAGNGLLGNDGPGVGTSNAPDTQIGGPGSGEHNVIGGNGGPAVDADAQSPRTVIENNILGEGINE